MNVRILKIPTVFDYPKVFSKGMWSLMKQVYCGHKVISNDDMDFDVSKVLMIMTLIIQKPTVIPPSLMVLFRSTLLT